MFQTFTGSSRRPRQVNLSGRSATNPFAGASAGTGSQAAILSAQQERDRRQRERDRLNAAKTLQRTWRGHRSRKLVKERWREQWDATESLPTGQGQLPPYSSDDEALMQLQRLLHFVDAHDESDVARFLLCWRKMPQSAVESVRRNPHGPWPAAYLRSQKTILSMLDHWILHRKYTAARLDILNLLAMITLEIADLTARNADQLYRTLASYVGSTGTTWAESDPEIEQEWRAVTNIALYPLQPMYPESLHSYAAFACEWLTMQYWSQPNLHFILQQLARHIDSRRLASALSTILSAWNFAGYPELTDSRNRLTLLGCFIYINREATKLGGSLASQKDYVHVISSLLSSVEQDVNVDGPPPDSDRDNDSGPSMSMFVHSQILSLVNQESIGSLLSGVRDSGETNGAVRLDDEAKQLASYALTLLRFFSRRGDEIRMWLYLGSTSSSPSGHRTPAIKYFWQAAYSSSIFNTISKDSRAAVKLLKPQTSLNQKWQPPQSEKAQYEAVQDEWRVILVFLELYTFVLKLMDDQEFFSAAASPGLKAHDTESWAGYNALPLDEVKDLTTFLKNLGFTMYFNAADIADASERDGNIGSLSSYFSASGGAEPDQTAQEEVKHTEPTVAGLAGMTMDYVKGLVTGILRMIYERDSRRKFLPKDHWLMTSRFDMGAFIPAVVQEEENRHRVQEEDEADIDQHGEDVDEEGPHLIGTGRDQRLRHIERLQRRQRKASRKRYLQAVAPRLEILQNMPFFIPFETRVQIFREFVHLDQTKRRNGYVDPDTWRVAVMQGSFGRTFPPNEMLMRHHAKIRRKHEFEDAYEQFYDLKDGLKEPIQITFVDQFDTVEAGIDGGGVTKEFLTSVTSEVFAPNDGLNLFIENEDHLLYPNPAAWEERREMLRQAGYSPSSAEFREQMNDLLQRYEFVGRIIGKCLYEGILVDVNFAGFFLLKWALTGGTGSAPRESGYRANLNDLRELDKELYQGLLQLKNYTGDVEDFALNFTITDTIKDYATGATKTITRDLKPDGANTPVTNANRLVYISYVARHRLQIEPYRQTSAFLRGLASMIQPSWLSMFNQSELQTLLGGTSSSIDVADLRAHTQYGGVYVIGDDGLEHPTIQAFWAVLAALPDAERRAVLKFVTSTPRAPLLGFASLNPRFSIRDSGDDESRLPSTSTCVNLLKLPRYRDRDTLREKLLYAVHSGAGFDLS